VRQALAGSAARRLIWERRPRQLAAVVEAAQRQAPAEEVLPLRGARIRAQRPGRRQWLRLSPQSIPHRLPPAIAVLRTPLVTQADPSAWETARHKRPGSREMRLLLQPVRYGELTSFDLPRSLQCGGNHLRSGCNAACAIRLRNRRKNVRELGQQAPEIRVERRLGRKPCPLWMVVGFSPSGRSAR